MRGRQTLYLNMRRDSNRPPATVTEVARGRKRLSRRGFPLLIPGAAAIICIYTDWGNLKIVSCVAWLNEPDPAAQRCSNREWAHWGRPLPGRDGAWRDSEGLAGHVRKRVPRGPIGRCGKVQVIWYLLLIQKQLENSPSGLWRTPGTRVGLTPSGVQIPHSPPVGTRSRQLPGPGSFV